MEAAVLGTFHSSVSPTAQRPHVLCKSRKFGSPGRYSLASAQGLSLFMAIFLQQSKCQQQQQLFHAPFSFGESACLLGGSGSRSKLQAFRRGIPLPEGKGSWAISFPQPNAIISSL